MSASTTEGDLFAWSSPPTKTPAPPSAKFMAWIVSGDELDAASTVVVDGLKQEGKSL